MRLYYYPASTNARRAHLTAQQLGLELELELVDLAKGQHRSPAFLQLNPNGAVPVLEDKGFVLTESHAIMQYLADVTPGQTVYPTGNVPRADVNRWLFWNAAHFQPAVSVLNWEYVVKPLIGGGEPDPAAIARGTTAVTRYAGVLDGHLAGKQWIAQDRLTLADLAIVCTLMPMVPAKLPVGDCRHLLAWLERVHALDSWKATNR